MAPAITQAVAFIIPLHYASTYTRNCRPSPISNYTYTMAGKPLSDTKKQQNIYKQEEKFQTQAIAAYIVECMKPKGKGAWTVALDFQKL